MIHIPSAALQTSYPNPFPGLTASGFGSLLEAECFCGLVRGQLQEGRDRGRGDRPSLFEIGTYLGAGVCHFHAMAPELELHSLNVLPEDLAHLPRLMPGEILSREEIGRLAREGGVPFVQHLGDSRTFDWQGLATRHRFDIVFIDGNHEQFTVMADTLHALQILKPDGLLIWHDYKVIDQPGRDVFAAINDLDEHEFAGQVHHVEGTWLAYAKLPLRPRTQRASITAGSDALNSLQLNPEAPERGLRLKPAPAWYENSSEAMSWHLAHERKVSFHQRVQGLPEVPRVLFFSDHRNPVWPGEADLAGLEGRYEVSRDHTQVGKADIVVFHLPQVPAWTQVPRHARQIWAGVTMEPDAVCPWQADPYFVSTLDALFSFHAFADIQMTHVRLDTLAEMLLPPPPKDPEKLVCAFFSGEFPQPGWERMIGRLEKLLPVHHYGGWHHNRPGNPVVRREERLEVMRQYQFCLAFEKSSQGDYVTDVWYDCLQAGCVPVYLGAPNISDYAPGRNLHLQVTPGVSLTGVAGAIRDTDGTTPLYKDYFAWKQDVSPSFTGLHERPADRLTLLEKLDLLISLTRGGICWDGK